MIAVSGQVGVNLLQQGYGPAQPRDVEADNMETRTLFMNAGRQALVVDNGRRDVFVDNDRRELMR